MVTDDNKIQRNRENKMNTKSQRIQESERNRDEPSVIGSNNNEDRLNESKEMIQDTQDLRNEHHIESTVPYTAAV